MPCNALTTLAMMEKADKNPAAATLVYLPGMLLVGGGVPVKVGNGVIGAVDNDGETLALLQARP